MKRFTRVIILLSIFGFLFSNCSFALRSTAYDESRRGLRLTSLYDKLDEHEKAILHEILSDPSFPLRFSPQPNPEARNILAAVLVHVLTPDEATFMLKELFPRRGQAAVWEDTIREALESVGKALPRAEPKPVEQTALMIGNEFIDMILADVKADYDMIRTGVENLIREHKHKAIVHHDVVSYIERRLRGLRRTDSARYSDVALSVMRYKLGWEVLFREHHYSAEIDLLEKGVREIVQYPLAYQIRYYDALGMAYESAGGSATGYRGIIDEKEFREAVDNLLTAEEYYNVALALSAQLETELQDLRKAKPELTAQCEDALADLRYFRYIVYSAVHNTNYYFISILGLVEPPKIDQATLAERGRRIRGDLRDVESMDIRTAALRTIIATYVVLHDEGIEIIAPLKELVNDILLHKPGEVSKMTKGTNKLIIRRLGYRPFDLLPHKEEVQISQGV